MIKAGGRLEFDDPPPEPMGLLRAWLERAEREGVASPGEAVVATVDAHGQPTTRVLGLREIHDAGLVFFVNLATRKGVDLHGNPRAAATFYWRESFQQINMSGVVEHLDADISDRLWAERGLDGPAASLASQQGQPLSDEAALRRQVAQLTTAGVLPPRPDHHAAIRLRPSAVEFWQGQPDRLHIRLHYSRDGTSWRHWRLQP